MGDNTIYVWSPEESVGELPPILLNSPHQEDNMVHLSTAILQAPACEDVSDLLPSKVQDKEQYATPISRYIFNQVNTASLIYIYYKIISKNCESFRLVSWSTSVGKDPKDGITEWFEGMDMKLVFFKQPENYK